MTESSFVWLRNDYLDRRGAIWWLLSSSSSLNLLKLSNNKISVH